jgi:large subunit ribosomal protein L6
MSRLGKKPVTLPKGVKFALEGRTITVEGPKGEKLSYEHRPEVTVTFDKDTGEVVVSRDDDLRPTRAYHGLTRALIQNMVVGVTTGYQKRLEIHGVGYQANLSGSTLKLRVGFANEIVFTVPQGLQVSVAREPALPPATGLCDVITIRGTDKQMVGEFAAQVRSCRKAEPYKGKGIRYAGEQVRRKAGKAQSK